MPLAPKDHNKYVSIRRIDIYFLVFLLLSLAIFSLAYAHTVKYKEANKKAIEIISDHCLTGEQYTLKIESEIYIISCIKQQAPEVQKINLDYLNKLRRA